MPSSTIEIIISIAIVGMMLWAVFRGGAHNPVGTGHLDKQVRALVPRIVVVEEKLDDVASRAELALLASEVKAVEMKMATAGDLLALQGQMRELNAKLAGIEKSADRTEQAVNRIEGHFLQKGINGQ